jgi:hypothetical protein
VLAESVTLKREVRLEFTSEDDGKYTILSSLLPARSRADRMTEIVHLFRNVHPGSNLRAEQDKITRKPGR